MKDLTIDEAMNLFDEAYSAVSHDVAKHDCTQVVDQLKTDLNTIPSPNVVSLLSFLFYIDGNGVMRLTTSIFGEVRCLQAGLIVGRSIINNPQSAEIIDTLKIH